MQARADTDELRFEGAIAGVRNGHVIGWAWDRLGPDAAAEIEILVEGAVVATGRAGEFRSGLLAAGKGNGRHGFRIPLPERLLDGREARVEARIRRIGTGLRNARATAVLEPGAGGRAGLPDLDVAPPNGKAMALLGRDDWLFLCNQRTMEQITGSSRLSDAQLEVYREAFVQRRDRCRDLGIPYLFAPAPMKELIHQAWLPTGFPVTKQPTPWEQIQEVLRNVPGVHAIDMRETLNAALRTEQVYFRTDHHLNILGCWHLYRELLAHAARYMPDLEPRPFDDFDYEPWADWQGDLASKVKATVVRRKLVTLPPEKTQPATRWKERVMRHRADSLRAREISAVPDDYAVSATRRTRIFGLDDSSLPRAVVVRDSFGEQLIPYLAEHFSRSVYLWVSNPPFHVIERERPDVVLHVMAERFLIRTPLLPDAEQAGADVLQRST